MDALKEFLESSTIHGIGYISTAPSKASKTLWFVIVLTGFVTAFCLINNSYVSWEESPVLTSISTHPISQLKFPNITICPPEGSNTALNYDLMRSQNVTLSEQDRKELIDWMSKMLLELPSIEYVKKAKEMVNEGNIESIMTATTHTFTYPNPYKDPEIDNAWGYEIFTSSLNGNLTTPGLGENIEALDQSYFNMHFTIEFPLVLKGMKGNHTTYVEIKIEQNTVEDNAMEIQYREGSKYIFFKISKTWKDAEEHCVSQGGHLASLHSNPDFLALNTA